MMAAPPSRSTSAFDTPPSPSPTAFQFSASTFASLGYSASFAQGLFRDQAALSSPPATPQRSQLVSRPQRPRRVSSVSTTSSPIRATLPHSTSYSVPPLGQQAALPLEQLQINEVDKFQHHKTTTGFLSKIRLPGSSRARKGSLETKEIRMLGSQAVEEGSLLDPTPKPPKPAGTVGRSTRSRRSLPLQPAPPPPTTSLPPLPIFVPCRSASPNLQPQPTLVDRRHQRNRSPAVVVAALTTTDVDERTRDRERALRALEGRR